MAGVAKGVKELITGSESRKARKESEAAEAAFRQQQAVSNERQTAALQRENSNTSVRARPRRGRRLFAAAQDANSVSRPSKRDLS